VQSQRLILPDSTIRINFEHSSDAFRLIAGAGSPPQHFEYLLLIESCELEVTRVNLVPPLLKSIGDNLAAGRRAIYPYKNWALTGPHHLSQDARNFRLRYHMVF